MVQRRLSAKVNFETEVEIKSDYRKVMPIGGVQSRHATAVILSFYGFDSEVCYLMQIMSHKTRAYIVNTDGLKGFLPRFSVVNWLRRIEK